MDLKETRKTEYTCTAKETIGLQRAEDLNTKKCASSFFQFRLCSFFGLSLIPLNVFLGVTHLLLLPLCSLSLFSVSLFCLVSSTPTSVYVLYITCSTNGLTAYKYTGGNDLTPTNKTKTVLSVGLQPLSPNPTT